MINNQSNGRYIIVYSPQNKCDTAKNNDLCEKNHNRREIEFLGLKKP